MKMNLRLKDHEFMNDSNFLSFLNTSASTSSVSLVPIRNLTRDKTTILTPHANLDLTVNSKLFKQFKPFKHFKTVDLFTTSETVVKSQPQYLQLIQSSNLCLLPVNLNINLIDLLTLPKKCQHIQLKKPDPEPISLEHCHWPYGRDFIELFKVFKLFESLSLNRFNCSVYALDSKHSKSDTDNKTQSLSGSYSGTIGTHLRPSLLLEVETQKEEMKEDKAFEVILKSLLSGGIAGMCAKTAVAPLDRMKILLQAHSRHYSHLGVFSGLKGIVEKESLIALYKGNGAQMVRIFPYAATQFTSFETYKKLFGENSHIGRFAAGSAAGVTAVTLTYPLDTIRARLAFQVSGEHVYNGIYQCATHMFKQEGGIRSLYRGFIPTICGMIPYAGLSFYCFESFKYLCMKYFPALTCKRHSTNTGGLVLLLPYKLLCGGIAGAAAQTVSYPLDVTRRRMQLAMMNESTKKFGMGMVPTLKMIYQENGISRGLYRGMSINYLRAIPMVAVSFSTYELVKQILGMDTGLPIKTG